MRVHIQSSTLLAYSTTVYDCCGCSSTRISMGLQRLDLVAAVGSPGMYDLLRDIL